MPDAELRRAEEVCAPYLSGLTVSERSEFLRRAMVAARVEPLTGYRLHCQLSGLRSAFLRGLIGNTTYGRSLRGYRIVSHRPDQVRKRSRLQLREAEARGQRQLRILAESRGGRALRAEEE